MADETSRRYLFVAIDRATRWVFIRIYKSKTAANARRFLRDLDRACPMHIRTILTDNVVSEDRVDAIGDGLEQVFEELPCGLAICLVHELGDCEFAGPVNTHEEVEFALRRLNLGDVDMKEADRVSLEPLPLWLVALDVRQAREAIPLQASM
jgi:hypothetical protein